MRFQLIFTTIILLLTISNGAMAAQQARGVSGCKKVYLRNGTYKTMCSQTLPLPGSPETVLSKNRCYNEDQTDEKYFVTLKTVGRLEIADIVTAGAGWILTKVPELSAGTTYTFRDVNGTQLVWHGSYGAGELMFADNNLTININCP